VHILSIVCCQYKEHEEVLTVIRNSFTDDVDNDDEAELEEAAAGSLLAKEKEEGFVAMAAVPSAPVRFSEASKSGFSGSTVVAGQISANGLMVINENGEEERRTVTSIFAGAERCRR
jgi:hypothetical protein